MPFKDEQILGAERVDSLSEDRFAEEAAERRHQAQQERAQQLRKRREGQSLPDRLSGVLRASGALSTASAAAIAAMPSGTPSTSAPPRADHLALGFMSAERVAELLRFIELSVVELERGLDAALYGVHERELSGLPTEAKDKRLIEEYEGLTPEAVAGITDAFGSPRVIARVRRQYARNPQNGVKL